MSHCSPPHSQWKPRVYWKPIKWRPKGFDKDETRRFTICERGKECKVISLHPLAFFFIRRSLCVTKYLWRSDTIDIKMSGEPEVSSNSTLQWKHTWHRTDPIPCLHGTAFFRIVSLSQGRELNSHGRLQAVDCPRDEYLFTQLILGWDRTAYLSGTDSDHL